LKALDAKEDEEEEEEVVVEEAKADEGERVSLQAVETADTLVTIEEEERKDEAEQVEAPPDPQPHRLETQV